MVGPTREGSRPAPDLHAMPLTGPPWWPNCVVVESGTTDRRFQGIHLSTRLQRMCGALGRGQVDRLEDKLAKLEGQVADLRALIQARFSPKFQGFVPLPENVDLRIVPFGIVPPPQTRETSLRRVPRELKMLKGHLLRVM